MMMMKMIMMGMMMTIIMIMDIVIFTLVLLLVGFFFFYHFPVHSISTEIFVESDNMKIVHYAKSAKESAESFEQNYI